MDEKKAGQFIRRRLKRKRLKRDRVFFFVTSRSLLREQLRRQYGNKGLRDAWKRYQDQGNRGEPKLGSFVKSERL